MKNYQLQWNDFFVFFFLHWCVKIGDNFRMNNLIIEMWKIKKKDTKNIGYKRFGVEYKQWQKWFIEMWITRVEWNHRA